MGKTSLLNYIADPGVRQRYGFDRPGDVFLYVDLQLVDQSTTPARLWQRLLRQLGRAWMHWTGVRGMSPEGELVLANTLRGSPQFGQQRLNREQFAVLGPFFIIWIEP